MHEAWRNSSIAASSGCAPCPVWSPPPSPSACRTSASSTWARESWSPAEPGEFVFSSTATYVTPGYFETLRMSVLRGRPFPTRDTTTHTKVAIVNDAFARRYFDGRDPIGERLRMGGEVREIVGVVGQRPTAWRLPGVRSDRCAARDLCAVLAIPARRLAHHPRLVLDGVAGARDLGGAVTDQALRRAMADVDPQLPLSAVRGVDEVRSAALSRQRMLMMLVAALGAAALLLAAIGIHALIASGVAERTRELGIRMALGATVGQTVRDAALPGILMAIAGLAIGCAVAYGTSGLIRSLLWGVKANDPLTFIAVVATLLAVAIVASIVPALRVRRLDPVSLLRSE